MRNFKIHLKSGEVVTVAGERLWTVKKDNDDVNNQILEVIIDTPMKEYPDKYSATVVAVFPMGEVVAAYDGEKQKP